MLSLLTAQATLYAKLSFFEGQIMLLAPNSAGRIEHPQGYANLTGLIWHCAVCRAPRPSSPGTPPAVSEASLFAPLSLERPAAPPPSSFLMQGEQHT